MFDVLKTPGRHHPFVLLQPRPELKDVLPSAAAGKLADLGPARSVFVGMVEETGSLFAMSPDTFPLVVFGGAQGSQPESSDHVSRIDAGPSVDAVTEARRLRNMCRNGSPDRRCLTGVRDLELSGNSPLGRRLLDGVPLPVVPHQPSSPPELRTDIPRSSNSGMVAIDDDHHRVERLPSVISSWPSSPIVGSTIGSVGMFSALGSLVVALALAVLWLVAKKAPSPRIENITALPAAESITALPAVTPTSEDILPVQEIVQEEKSAIVEPGTLLEVPDLVEAAVESDNEKGKDAEVPSTPNKKSFRRGKRGGKKGKKNAAESKEEEEEPVPPLFKEVEIALPSSLILPSTPKLPAAVTSLVVTETVLGKPFSPS